MKKLLILLLLLCVSTPAMAESSAERLARLDFIVQADERIQDEEFYYYGAPFWVAGCLPASATNGMIAVLGTPEIDSHRLLKQFLSGLRHEEQGPEVELSYLYYTTKSPRSAAYEMQALVAPVTRFYAYDSVKPSATAPSSWAQTAATITRCPLCGCRSVSAGSGSPKRPRS